MALYQFEADPWLQNAGLYDALLFVECDEAEWLGYPEHVQKASSVVREGP